MYSPSKNTNKKFKLIYKLNNVAVKYNDIGDGIKVNLKDIEEYSKENRNKFFDYFYNWKIKVKEEFNKKEYYDKSRIKLAHSFISISFIEILLMIIFLSYSIAASLAAMITGKFILIYSFSLYRIKTQYGESQFRMWKNFKVHLENESFVKYEKLKSIDNIDKYLVYAIALEINSEVFEKLNINIDTKSNSGDDYYASCLYWYFCLDMDSSDNTIQNSLYNHSNANDGGGGFSSGDGGGCAGGGDAGGF
ncbi:DUF2207 family protein [Clostridium thailandense]|uniref:DUF2207 family protein n=1 Tax=Clostridium thailandense TaxID=2794346 RepID=UPI003989CA9A